MDLLPKIHFSSGSSTCVRHFKQAAFKLLDNVLRISVVTASKGFFRSLLTGTADTEVVKREAIPDVLCNHVT